MPTLESLAPLPGNTRFEGAEAKGKVSVLRQGVCQSSTVPSTLQAGGHSCGVQVSSRASTSLLKSCRKSEQHRSQHLPQCQGRAFICSTLRVPRASQRASEQSDFNLSRSLTSHPVWAPRERGDAGEEDPVRSAAPPTPPPRAQVQQ